MKLWNLAGRRHQASKTTNEEKTDSFLFRQYQTVLETMLQRMARTMVLLLCSSNTRCFGSNFNRWDVTTNIWRGFTNKWFAVIRLLGSTKNQWILPEVFLFREKTSLVQFNYAGIYSNPDFITRLMRFPSGICLYNPKTPSKFACTHTFPTYSKDLLSLDQIPVLLEIQRSLLLLKILLVPLPIITLVVFLLG